MAETLQELDISNTTATKIKNGALYKCSGLTSIALPKSVTKIESKDSRLTYDIEAFYHCTGLTSVTVHPDNPVYSSENGVLFNKNKTDLIFYPTERKGDYTIPHSVKKMRNGIFANCKYLTSVTIPASVTEIGYGAFVRCYGLTSVTIPASVTEIGHYAFFYCVNLTSVTIPNSVKKIGYYAFDSCKSLTSVTIPASVTEIGKDAFYNYSTFITVHPDNPVYTSVNGELKRKKESKK